jgi:protein RecA
VSDKAKEMQDLQKALKAIQKDFGKGSAILLGDNNTIDCEFIPIDSLKLSRIMGGGIPRGKIIEIFGPESSGKTTISNYLVGQAQKAGFNCAFIDAEHAYTPQYAKKVGVDINNLIFTQPDSGEQALEICEKMIDEIPNLGVIVIDSIASLTPQAEIDGEMGDSHMGLQARLLSQAMRKLTAKLGKKKVTLIAINQIRCVDENSIVFTNEGLKKIKDVKIGDNIFDRFVLNKQETGKMKGFEISTKNNSLVKVSEKHRHVCIENGEYKIKSAMDITTNDWIVSPIVNDLTHLKKPYISLKNIVNNVNSNLESKHKKVALPDVLDENLAFIFGCYFSDGHIIDYDNSTYGISWGEKDEDRYSLISEAVFKCFPEVSIKNNINLNGKQYKDFFESCGLFRYGKNKVIPDLIIQSSFSVIRSFIRGAFFDTHGFNKNNGFIFTCENQKAILTIQTILYYCGIFADYVVDHGNYRLFITGDDAYNFNKIFGFAEIKKQKFASNFSENKNARGKNDVVPNSLGERLFKKYNNSPLKRTYEKYNAVNMCSFKKLNFGRRYLLGFLRHVNAEKSDINLIENNRFYKVYNKKEIYINCVDVEVDKDNIYNLNGQLTHNCKIGIVYGNPETTPGGNALKFYASIRLTSRKKEEIVDGTNLKGIRINVKAIKNKVATPMRNDILDLYFATGFDVMGEVIDFAVHYGLIEKGGAWFNIPNVEEKFQGKRKVIKYYNEHKKELLDLREQVLQRINTNVEEIDEDGNTDSE